MAVTVGTVGLTAVQHLAAADDDPSVIVPITPTRILDTRVGLGLTGPFTSATPRDLQVTGAVPTPAGTATVVPPGATGVVLNVTAVHPTAPGFVSIRPAGTPGPPTTSNLNVTAGDIVPNAVTVALSVDGVIELTFDAFAVAGPTTDLLVDAVAYLVAGAGAPGPAGPAGPPGPAGPAGPAGSPGEPLSGVNWSESTTSTLLSGTIASIESVTIDVPQDGYVVATASWYFLYGAPNVEAACYLTQGAPSETRPWRYSRSNSEQFHRDNASLTRAFPVTTGQHTFHLSCHRTIGVDHVFIADPTLVVQFAPQRYQP